MNFLHFLKSKIKKRIKKIDRLYRFHILTPFIARTATQKIIKAGSKGLFLDCGSNIGQGFEFFRKHFKKQYFDYELFEPNPNCLPFLHEICKKLPDHNIKIHEKAIGVRNETLTFYGLSEQNGGGALSQGGSILREHNSGIYASEEKTAIQVNSINFCDFLRDKINSYELIVIKMDIEGGEYEVLEHLLKENLFNSIDSMFCEFHSQYMKAEEKVKFRKKEIDFISSVANTSCRFNLWI